MELLITAFDDIPFHADMGDVEALLMDDLKELLGPHITAPVVARAGTGWTMTKWLVADARLLRRTLRIDAVGRLARADEVFEAALPCPVGRYWGIDASGRLVPIG